MAQITAVKNQYFCHRTGNLKTTHRCILQPKTRDNSTRELSSRTMEQKHCFVMPNTMDPLRHTWAQKQSEAHWSLWLCDDVSLAWLCPLISYRAFHTDSYLQWQSKRKSFVLNQSLWFNATWATAADGSATERSRVQHRLWRPRDPSTGTVLYSRQVRTTIEHVSIELSNSAQACN